MEQVCSFGQISNYIPYSFYKLYVGEENASTNKPAKIQQVDITVNNLDSEIQQNMSIVDIE